MYFKNLFITLVLSLIFSSVSFAEEIPCAYSSEEEKDACTPGTASNLLRSAFYATDVLVGKFGWDNVSDVNELIKSGLVDVNFHVTKVLKGDAEEFSKVSVKLSNALLVYPGAKLSRGQVISALSKISNHPHKLAELKKMINQNGLEKAFLFSDYIKNESSIDEMFSMQSIYHDGFDSREDRSIVIERGTQYVVLFNRTQDVFYFSAVESARTLYLASPKILDLLVENLNTQ